MTSGAGGAGGATGSTASGDDATTAGGGVPGSEITAGRPGVLHGNRTYVLQDDDGQVIETHSVSAGMDYPGVGPEHAWLKDSGRAEYVTITDAEALQAAAALGLGLIAGMYLRGLVLDYRVGPFISVAEIAEFADGP